MYSQAGITSYRGNGFFPSTQLTFPTNALLSPIATQAGPSEQLHLAKLLAASPLIDVAAQDEKEAY